MMYVRVKDKRTGHRFDVLKKQYDPDKHQLVKSGPYKGESTHPRRVQLKIRQATLSATQTSGEPSGDNNEESED